MKTFLSALFTGLLTVFYYSEVLKEYNEFLFALLVAIYSTWIAFVCICAYNKFSTSYGTKK